MSLVAAGTRNWGRLPERPRLVNPLDEYAGLARRWRDFRLKEWVGFTLIHPELYGAMTMQNAKYRAFSELHVYDRASGSLHAHAATAHGGAVALPDELLHGGACRFSAPGYALQYDFDEDAGTHSIRISTGASNSGGQLRGELTLDARGASSPLSVSSRLGGGASMFTYKRIYPVSGLLKVADRVFTFDADRDFAVIDEHRSHLPYGTRWTWGTFAFRNEDGIVGANVAERAQPPGEEEESCIWTPFAAEPLTGVRFHPVSNHPLASWRMTSADGRLDVTFTPEGRRAVKQNLGVVAADCAQLFGVYEGEIAGYAVEAAHGSCARTRLRG